MRVISILLLTAAILGGCLLWMSVRGLREQAQGAQLALARSLASQVDVGVSQAYQAVQVLSEQPVLASLDAPAVAHELDLVTSATELLDNLMVVLPDGRVLAKSLPQVAPDIADGRVIVAHLGSGASMCALMGGRSVETTMGFTALDGLPMGTRPGQIDPGVVLYLLAEKRMSAGEVQNFLYQDCGLKGLSGISNDVRELEASEDAKARFTLDYFVYRVSLQAGLLAAAMGGVDAVVFTAGVGENSPALRARIAERLGWLGARLDPVANAAGATLISRQDSRIGIYVIPTDEELMIARHTVALIATAPGR